jgi:hypothetical protein
MLKNKTYQSIKPHIKSNVQRNNEIEAVVAKGIPVFGTPGTKRTLLDTYTMLTGAKVSVLKEKMQESDKIYKELHEIFIGLSHNTGLSIKFLAEYVFEITPKTYTSYTKDRKLPNHIVEKTIKLGELYIKGEELFGTVEKFNEWLKKESYGLNNQIPTNLLNTIIGIEFIMDELYKIEFGATA